MEGLELLAPAGSFEALRAGIQNGADAVYLGGRDFGARAYASNFDRASLERAVEYAHIRGVKIYVTVNTLIKDLEIKDLMEYIKFLYEIDVDALIVQDIGVFRLVKNIFPDLKIHASTQMTLHNKYGVRLLRDMGVNRVVLARELTIEEIKDIYDETGVELEVFVHGALCVSYSGQCLMSSFIGGRSGNRGRCAQPCRREYDLLSLGNDKTLNNRAFHLSMRDLNTLEEIGELIEAGVRSFKIEGRMKKPEYVASVVRAYRRAIDTYLSSKKPLKDRAIQEEIKQVFNRKFTRGYLFKSPKSDLVNIEKPNNRGLYLGQVGQVNKRANRFRIKLETTISRGDGIEIWSGSSGDMGGLVTNIYMDNRPVDRAERGQTVEIEIRGHIEGGRKVYKTLDAGLVRELEKSYEENREYRKIALYGEIEVKIGDHIRLYLWDGEGHSVYLESGQTVERARKVPITEDKILDQLSKLGNTPYQLDSLAITLEENSSIAISLLNGLRREGVEKLSNLRKSRNNRKTIGGEEFLKGVENVLKLDYREDKNSNGGQGLSVKVNSLDQLRAVLQYNIDRIYYGNMANFKEAVSLCRDKNIEIYLASPTILRNSDYKKLADLVNGLGYDGILAGDLGMVDFNRLHGKLPIVGDFSLNVMNTHTIRALEGLGLDGLTLSTELDFRNIYKLNLDSKIEKEAIIYGKTTVMVTEYCPLIQENKCNHKCQACNFPKYEYRLALKDGKNAIFPMAKDYWGRTLILNSKPLFILDKLEDFKTTNINWFRLEFTDENIGEIEGIIDLSLKNMNFIRENKKIPSLEDYTIKFKDGFTRGHYYRGVD